MKLSDDFNNYKINHEMEMKFQVFNSPISIAKKKNSLSDDQKIVLFTIKIMSMAE